MPSLYRKPAAPGLASLAQSYVAPSCALFSCVVIRCVVISWIVCRLTDSVEDCRADAQLCHGIKRLEGRVIVHDVAADAAALLCELH